MEDFKVNRNGYRRLEEWNSDYSFVPKEDITEDIFRIIKVQTTGIISKWINEEKNKSFRSRDGRDPRKIEEAIRKRYERRLGYLTEIEQNAHQVTEEENILSKLRDIKEIMSDIGIEDDRAYRKLGNIMKKKNAMILKSNKRVEKISGELKGLPVKEIYIESNQRDESNMYIPGFDKYTVKQDGPLDSFPILDDEVGTLYKAMYTNLRFQRQSEKESKINEYMLENKCSREEAEKAMQEEEKERYIDKKQFDADEILEALGSMELLKAIYKLDKGDNEKVLGKIARDRKSLTQYKEFLEQKSSYKRSIDKLGIIITRITEMTDEQLGGAKEKVKMIRMLRAKQEKEKRKMQELERKSKKFADKKGVTEYLRNAQEFKKYNEEHKKITAPLDPQRRAILGEKGMEDLEESKKYVQKFCESLISSKLRSRNQQLSLPPAKTPERNFKEKVRIKGEEGRNDEKGRNVEEEEKVQKTPQQEIDKGDVRGGR